MSLGEWSRGRSRSFRASLGTACSISAVWATPTGRGARRRSAVDGHYTLDQQHNFIRDIKSCGRVAAGRDLAMSFLSCGPAVAGRIVHDACN
jgi:hypothetical protein